jgi:hypothetical protein
MEMETLFFEILFFWNQQNDQRKFLLVPEKKDFRKKVVMYSAIGS